MTSILSLNKKGKTSSQAFFSIGHDQNIWIIVSKDAESHEGRSIMMFLFIFLFHELTTKA